MNDVTWGAFCLFLVSEGLQVLLLLGTVAFLLAACGCMLEHTTLQQSIDRHNKEQDQLPREQVVANAIVLHDRGQVANAKRKQYLFLVFGFVCFVLFLCAHYIVATDIAPAL